ncbi:MAG TPA: hypothetical protein ENH91_10260 [Leeuwenhoekiella sp.]|nr:hypothetical protein [Leeuwenhoekiella sp.]
MKKLMLVIVALLMGSSVFAQALSPEINWMEMFIWAGGGLLSIEKVAQGVLLITQALKKLTGSNGTITWVISIGVGQAIAVVGKLLLSGIFLDVPWVAALVLGFAGTLLANEVFTVEEIKDLLKRKLPRDDQSA